MDPQTPAVVTGGEQGAQSGTDGVSGQNQGTGDGSAIVERSHRQGAPPDGGTATASTAPSPPPGETLEHWKQRYAGLQGNFQQERAQAQQAIQQAEQARVAAEQRAQRAEAAAWEGQWRLQGFSPEQIVQAKTGLQAQQRLAAAQAKVQADAQALVNERAAFRQATEGPAREIVAARIAREEGVPVERIAHLSHPDLMRELAKEIRSLGRSANLSGRRAAGTDRAESGGGGGIDVSKMSAHERIKAGLKQFHAQRR